MSEFIVIQVGQCGNQIGSVFWSEILKEYGFYTENQSSNRSSNYDFRSSLHSFFCVSPKSNTNISTIRDALKFKVKARAILIDMEDRVISRYKIGPLKELFDDHCIIHDYLGSGNNWAQGYCYYGSRYKNEILATIYRMVDKCDNLQGFLLIYSAGGGTGSGLGSYILQLLDDNFSGIERFVTCIYPTGSEDVITCPYNMALSTKVLTDHANCVFPIENRALLDILKKFRQNESVIKFKTFEDMNKLIVNMILHLTCGSRFPGDINLDINEVSTNMTPFPKLHFLSTSVSPVLRSNYRLIKPQKSQCIKDEIFRNVCNGSNQFLKIDPLNNTATLLAVGLISRGPSFSISDMKNCIQKLQARNCFAPWSRKTVKIGLCDTPPPNSDVALLSLFNSSAIVPFFKYMVNSYDKIYNKKAHMHYYEQVAGFDRQYFEESKESLLFNIDSYSGIGRNTKVQT